VALIRQVHSKGVTPPRMLSDAMLCGVRTFLDPAYAESRSPDQPEAFSSYPRRKWKSIENFQSPKVFAKSGDFQRECREFANGANTARKIREMRGRLAALGVAESYLRHLRPSLQIIDAESGEITGTLTSPKLAIRVP
jgi:hypothetical protein